MVLGGGTLTQDWLLESIMMAFSFVAMSFAVIVIVGWHAHKRLMTTLKEGREIEIKPFWMERVLTARPMKYATLSILLSIGVTGLDFLISFLIAGPKPWWTDGPSTYAFRLVIVVLLNIACIAGLIASRKVYHYLTDEVLPEMMEKAKKSVEPKRIITVMKMFTQVCGGSPLYQGACAIWTVFLFVVIHISILIPRWQAIAGIKTGLDITPLLTDWLGLLSYIIIGGVVGPMATTVSGFIVYCGLVFRKGEFFDPFAIDRRGGFKALGSLGMWSSFMAAVTPGFAIPILFIDSRSKATFEMAISAGLVFFMLICVLLFFFVPIFFVHEAMRVSKEIDALEVERKYRVAYGEFMKKTQNGIFKDTLGVKEVAGILSLYTLKTRFDEITNASEWPMDYLTIFNVITSSLVPTLPYLLEFILHL